MSTVRSRNGEIPTYQNHTVRLLDMQKPKVSIAVIEKERERERDNE